MIFDVSSPDGFLGHCKVAALIINELPLNPHTKHHIRSAVREASLKVTKFKGTNKFSRATHASILALDKRSNKSSEDLILEHAVPVSLINEKVLELTKPTELDIANIIYEWTVLTVITKQEHDVLKNKGLPNRMPLNWDNIDKFARYKFCDIQFMKL
jgi:hypothetical protein